MHISPPSAEVLRQRRLQLSSRPCPGVLLPRHAQCSQPARASPIHTLSSGRTLCQEVESCTQDILRLAVLCRGATRKASSEVETHQTAPEDGKAQQDPPPQGAQSIHASKVIMPFTHYQHACKTRPVRTCEVFRQWVGGARRPSHFHALVCGILRYPGLRCSLIL